MDERLLRHEVLVFDVGNVLVRFDPREIADSFGLSDALYRGVFESGLWFWMDTGLMTEETLARMMCEAAHTSSEEDLARVTELLHDFVRVETALPISSLLPELRQAGKRLYYLSNYGPAAFDKTMKRFPFFQLFDGGVVSGREHILKPMPRIYELLCERCHFRPEEALFIDDNSDNIRAAEKLGFHTWLFEGLTEASH